MDAGDSQLAALHNQHRHGGGLHPAHQGLTQGVPEAQGETAFFIYLNIPVPGTFQYLSVLRILNPVLFLTPGSGMEKNPDPG